MYEFILILKKIVYVNVITGNFEGESSPSKRLLFLKRSFSQKFDSF